MHHHLPPNHQLASYEFRLPETYTQCLRTNLGLKNPDSADHDFTHLDADFRARLESVLAGMREQGYDTTLLEGYRSPARQGFLKREGINGINVTNAGQCQSFHQFGLAADIGFLKNGAPDLHTNQAWVMKGYKLLGRLAEEQGMKWGGSWGDFGHIELRKPVFSSLAAEWKKTQYALQQRWRNWKPFQPQVCAISSWWGDHKPSTHIRTIDPINIHAIVQASAMAWVGNNKQICEA